MSFPFSLIEARLDLAEAGQGLDELGLAIAVHAREAEDLAIAELEREVVDGGELAARVHVEVVDLEDYLAWFPCGLVDGEAHGAAYHHLGHPGFGPCLPHRRSR